MHVSIQSNKVYMKGTTKHGISSHLHVCNYILGSHLLYSRSQLDSRPSRKIASRHHDGPCLFGDVPGRISKRSMAKERHRGRADQGRNDKCCGNFPFPYSGDAPFGCKVDSGHDGDWHVPAIVPDGRIGCFVTANLSQPGPRSGGGLIPLLPQSGWTNDGPRIPRFAQ